MATRVHRFDWFWLLLLVVPPLLLFPRLGQTCLWQDEAETALLGQSVLAHGYPLAVEGTRVISDQPGHPDINAAGVWIWSPWLQDYVAAASFGVFGATTWAARFPFALLGWVALVLTYLMVADTVRDRRLGRYATILLMTSVPFLLHARQCRYYTLLALFTMVYLWGYVRLTRHARGGALLLIAGGIGLYHTFQPQLVAATAAMAAHTLLFHRNRAFLSRWALCTVVILATSLPFFIYTRSWSRNYEGAGSGFESAWRYLASLRAYLLQVHVYCWPVLLAVPLLWKRHKGKGPKPKDHRIALTLLAAAWLIALSASPSAWSFVTVGLLTAVSAVPLVRWAREGFGSKAGLRPLREEIALGALVFLASVLLFAGVSSYPFYRYLIGILPLGAVATAATVLALGSGRKWIAPVLMTGLVAFNVIQLGPFVLARTLAEATGLASEASSADEFGFIPANMNSDQTLRLASAPPRIHSLMWDYGQELTHDYLGPIGAIVPYLRTHARAGDVIVTSYEHFPLMFHTPLTVVTSRNAAAMPGLPEWIFWHGADPVPLPARLDLAIENRQYEQVSLPGREFGFENIPEPNWHRFRTPEDGPLVVLLHRVR